MTLSVVCFGGSDVTARVLRGGFDRIMTDGSPDILFGEDKRVIHVWLVRQKKQADAIGKKTAGIAR